jgi:hypothetical protein
MPSPAPYRVVRSLSRTPPGERPDKPTGWEERLNQLAARADQFLPLFEDGPPAPPQERGLLGRRGPNLRPPIAG